jgi:hypothetical protein
MWMWTSRRAYVPRCRRRIVAGGRVVDEPRSPEPRKQPARRSPPLRRRGGPDPGWPVFQRVVVSASCRAYAGGAWDDRRVDRWPPSSWCSCGRAWAPLCGKPWTRRHRSDGAFRQGLPRPRRLGAERLAGCGLVFGFSSVSGRFCPSRVTTLATCRFRVLEFPRRVARDAERRGPECRFQKAAAPASKAACTNVVGTPNSAA